MINKSNNNDNTGGGGGTIIAFCTPYYSCLDHWSCVPYFRGRRNIPTGVIYGWWAGLRFNNILIPVAE